MPTEMTRVETMNEMERELVNLLSPEERKNALVQAGEVRHRALDKKLMAAYLDKIRKGEVQPVTQIATARQGVLYELTGKTVYVKGDKSKPFTCLGRVPGHEGFHVLVDAEGKYEFWGGFYVSENPGEWTKDWDRLGSDED